MFTEGSRPRAYDAVDGPVTTAIEASVPPTAVPEAAQLAAKPPLAGPQFRYPNWGLRKALASGSVGKAWAPAAHREPAQANAARRTTVGGRKRRMFDRKVMGDPELWDANVLQALPPPAHFTQSFLIKNHQNTEYYR
jgi:hypothetical protein